MLESSINMDPEEFDEIPVSSQMFFQTAVINESDPISMTPNIDPLLECPVKSYNNTSHGERSKIEFLQEMNKNIRGIIQESIQLFKKHPIEYHPFYLRVFKYIIKGQLESHISKDEEEVFQIWKENNELANRVWETRSTFDSYLMEPSAYAIFIQKQRVIKNGRDVTVNRNENEVQKRFAELKTSARRIWEKWRAANKNGLVIDLKGRLEFFEQCKTMTFPADVVKMNDLWTLLVKGFVTSEIEDELNVPSNLLMEDILVHVDPFIAFHDVCDTEIPLSPTEVKPELDSPPVPVVKRRRKPPQKTVIKQPRKGRLQGKIKARKFKLSKELKVILGNQQCPYCDEISFVRKALEKHVRAYHPHNYFHCSLKGCSRMLLTPEEFVSHFKEHEDENSGKLSRKRKENKPNKRRSRSFQVPETDKIVVKGLRSGAKSIKSSTISKKVTKKERIKQRKLTRFLKKQRKLRFTIQKSNRRRIMYQRRVEKCSEKMQLTLDKLISQNRNAKCFQRQRLKRLLIKRTKRNNVKVEQRILLKTRYPCLYCHEAFTVKIKHRSHMEKSHPEMLKYNLKPNGPKRKRNYRIKSNERNTVKSEDLKETEKGPVRNKLSRNKNSILTEHKEEELFKTVTVNKNKPEHAVCEECGESFLVSSLANHKARFHDTSRPMSTCPICSAKFFEPHAVWIHFLREHINYDLVALSVAKGKSMGISYGSDEPLPKKQQKIKSQLNNNLNNVCDYCGAQFDFPHQLTRHCKNVHEAESLCCNKCGRTFKSKCALTGHIRQDHEGQDYRCDICNRKLQASGKLWKHKVEQHNMHDLPPPPGVTVEQCQYCGEKLLRGMRAHVNKVHPEKAHEFSVQVNEATQAERRLKLLMKKKEIRRKWREEGIVTQKWLMKDYTPKKCNMCEWTVPRHKGRIKWVQHMEQIHGIIIELYKKHRAESNAKQGKSGWPCPYENCDVILQRVSSLKKHIVNLHIVLGEDLCKKGYAEGKKNENGHWIYYCNVCENADKIKALFGKIGLNSMQEMMIHFFLHHSEIYNELKGILEPDISFGEVVKEVVRKKLRETYKCSHCGEECVGAKELRLHVEVNHPEAFWRCPIDGKVLLSPEEMADHFAKDHNEDVKSAPGEQETKFNAKMESTTYPKSKRRRKRAPGGKPRSRRQIQICPRCYESTDSLNDHVREKHPSSYFTCSGAPECEVGRFSERAIATHEDICKNCPSKPRRTKGSTNFRVNCEFCGKEILAMSLSKHYEGLHGVEEDDEWFCDICQVKKKYARREGWMLHMEEWHLDTEEKWKDFLKTAGKLNKRGFDRSKVKIWGNQSKLTIQRNTSSKRRNISTKAKRQKNSNTRKRQPSIIGNDRSSKKEPKLELDAEIKIEQETSSSPDTDSYFGSAEVIDTSSVSLRRSSRSKKTNFYKEYELDSESDTDQKWKK